MAFYKYQNRLSRQLGEEFDELHEPGDLVPLSGVYACEACGRSVVARRGELLPQGEDHVHPLHQPVLWRLVVRSHTG